MSYPATRVLAVLELRTADRGCERKRDVTSMLDRVLSVSFLTYGR